MELAVYNIKGEDTGKKVTLNDGVFGLSELNEHVVYLDVKQYLANFRFNPQAWPSERWRRCPSW